jgi:hypothetical protein
MKANIKNSPIRFSATHRPAFLRGQNLRSKQTNFSTAARASYRARAAWSMAAAQSCTAIPSGTLWSSSTMIGKSVWMVGHQRRQPWHVVGRRSRYVLGRPHHSIYRSCDTYLTVASAAWVDVGLAKDLNPCVLL